MFAPDSTQIEIYETDITWSDDIGKKFKRTPNSADTQWVDPENGNFFLMIKSYHNCQRTFYRMDEACRITKFQKIMGEDRNGLACWDISSLHF